jgi:hypothetical protein
VPERLAGGRVGQVHLDQGRRPHGQGVVQGIGVVRERGRVEHDRQPPVGGLVHPADELGLVVGLPDVHGQAELIAGGGAGRGDVGQGGPAVDLRLPGAEPAQVRAVEDQDGDPVRDHFRLGQRLGQPRLRQLRRGQAGVGQVRRRQAGLGQPGLGQAGRGQVGHDPLTSA